MMQNSHDRFTNVYYRLGFCSIRKRCRSPGEKMLKEIVDVFMMLDDPNINGEKVRQFFLERGHNRAEVRRTGGDEGLAEFIKIIVPGRSGKLIGGSSPTLGIIGRWDGSAPGKTGALSDADGVIASLAIALRLTEMAGEDDAPYGDVIVSTFLCYNALASDHNTASFLGSQIDMEAMNEIGVDPEMDTIISIGAAKGNRITSVRGFAITPVIREGCILPLPDGVIDVLQKSTRTGTDVICITSHDMEPYGGQNSINSILQPNTATSAGVMGVAIQPEDVVPWSSAWAMHVVNVAGACTFCIEIAKSYGSMKLKFF